MKKCIIIIIGQENGRPLEEGEEKKIIGQEEVFTSKLYITHSVFKVLQLLLEIKLFLQGELSRTC
jgi:hypothetical protein